MSFIANNLISEIEANGAQVSFISSLHCNMECPICIINAGSKMSKDKKIPIGDMYYYANQPNVFKILLSGGEVSAQGLDYFRDAAFTCVKGCNKLSIKTNAKWTEFENAADYADVIYQISKKYNDYEFLGGSESLNFGIDISVGASHENAVNYAFECLNLLPDKKSKCFKYNIHFVADSHNEACSFQSKAVSYGLTVSKRGYFNFPLHNIYGKITVLEKIIKKGRACKNNVGEMPAPLNFKTEHDVVKHIKDIGRGHIDLHFFPNGFVYFEDCEGRFLACTRYKENNVLLDIKQLVFKLADNLYARHLK